MTVKAYPEARLEPPKTLYFLFGKRLVDVAFAALGLAALSPLIAMTAALVKLTSPGPILFLQTRVGREGKVFTIFKFRTMTVGADKMGPGVTAGGDRRVTRIGKHLRKLKLDETPQLWNVLRGEMSLVGPRPELPIYVQLYTDWQRTVLSVRPGITDLASIAYKNEEKILAASSDPERYYREVIIGEKIKLNMEYIATISLCNDLRLIFRTIQAVTPMFS